MRKIDVATAVACGVAVVSILALGMFFYERSRSVLDTMLKSHIRTVASIAVEGIDGDAVERIIDVSSVQTEAFRSTVEVLQQIREDIPDIKYAYIMRQTEDPNMVIFVADADASLTEKELDENADGVIDAIEAVPLPGEPYDVTAIPELQGNAFVQPSVDQALTTDKWGTFLSAYAPVRNRKGHVVGALGIDMLANDYEQQVRQIFSPIAFVFLLSLAIVVVGVIVGIAQQRKILAAKRVEGERAWLTQLALHRVGNALSIFKFTTEILKEKLHAAGDDREMHEQIRDLEEGIGSLSALLQMVQRADAIQTDAINYEKQCSQLCTIVRKSIQKCAKREVKIVCPESIIVDIDANALEGALHEVVANAIQFSKDTVTISVVQKKSTVEIRVKDSGIGISNEDLPHVFEHFYAGKETWKSNPDAMGLGLYIAKGILDHMGGKIRIETATGEGTTVIIEIPVHEGECKKTARSAR